MGREEGGRGEVKGGIGISGGGKKEGKGKMDKVKRNEEIEVM